MARSAAQVQAEIDTLRTSLSKGILRVRHGDTETTYQNVTEMRNYIRDLQYELDGLATTSRIKQVRFVTGKGL